MHLKSNGRYWSSLALLCWLTSAPTAAVAGTVRLTVKDPTGAPIPKVLVILRSLYNGKEISRSLTDNEGKIPELKLKPGLYRATATYPYGLWKPEVREFLAGDRPVDVTLILQAAGTQDNIAILGAPHALLQVLNREGKPVPGALVIVRDTTATYEERHTSDHLGEANVYLIGEPTVLVVVDPPELVQRVVTAKSLLKSSPPKKAQARNKVEALPMIVIRLP
jgi:hypothetical protein